MLIISKLFRICNILPQVHEPFIIVVFLKQVKCEVNEKTSQDASDG